MRRRWPQLLSTAVVLLIALAALLLNTRGDGGAPPTATPRQATAIAVAATATPQASGAATAEGRTPTAARTATATRPPPTVRVPATAGDPQAAPAPTPTPDGALPTILFSQLPDEARETIRLIDAGGPFPYDRDGITFGNRERLLPLKPDGYYREYTVVTPGSADRGARRIIAGQAGERYYTDDHYASFRRVIR